MNELFQELQMLKNSYTDFEWMCLIINRHMNIIHLLA